MDEERVFISYARKQLYFAESLALNLEASGIPVWMDIQQLVPGSDWADGIRKGLENSTALILVASRQALKSPYVREEWRAALKANKPISIVFFENVQLPVELRDHPQVSYFNFRRKFNRKVGQLSDCLKSDKVHRDDVAAWRFLALPAAHWVVLASLLVPNIILLTWLVAIFAQGFVYFPETFTNNFIRELISSVSVVINWVYFIAAGLVFSGGFLFRRFEASNLKFFPWVFVLVLWFAYRTLDPITHGQSIFRVSVSDVPLYNDNFLLIILGLIGLAFASFWLQRKSADILRWMPLGQAPTKMRETINAVFLKSETHPSTMPKLQEGSTYQIFYDQGDELVAQEVVSRLHGLRCKPVDTSSDQPAQIAVFVLSNISDLEKLKQEAGVLPKRVIAVIATSIKMPESPEELFRFQWVDYRRREKEQLVQINTQLLEEDRVPSMLTGFTIDPERMGKVVVPKGIFFVTNGLRTLGAFVLSAGLYLLILLGMGKGDSWRGVLILLLGMAMFWLAGRMSGRQILSRLFIIGYGVLWLALFILGVSGILWVLMRNYGINPYTGQPTIFGYAMQAVILLTPPAVAVYYRGLIERWLPQSVKRAAPRKSLQLGTPCINWFVYTLVVLQLSLALLSSTQF